MNDYIINATTRLVSSQNSAIVSAIANDLQKINRAVPHIVDIICRGGCAIDVISGLEPNDVDLFYTYKENGQLATECKCDEVRAAFKNIEFSYFSGRDIDVENAYEKEPRLSPIERTVGVFSFHTEYNSQFAIDAELRYGQIPKHFITMNSRYTK
ncbi:MAG: hypothetical protein QY314_04810 [Candidatus Dojkabacteria bacterium]|nr:MAG: hypothetical protein QY314_04810 [Candidatus Dojkabacteria bacterium]